MSKYHYHGTCIRGMSCTAENYCAVTSKSGCQREGKQMPWRSPGWLAEWYSGETAVSCHQKCENRADCKAWTLNKNNGWCALDDGSNNRRNPGQFLDNPGFVSKAVQLCDVD